MWNKRLLITAWIMLSFSLGPIHELSKAADYDAIRLECINPKANAQFGHAVDLDGRFLVVGTCYDDLTTDEPGRAFVYLHEKGEWKPSFKLRPKGGETPVFFGWSVSISGTRILVGTRGGTAYLFTLDGGEWIEEGRLTARGIDPDDQFGWSVSLCDDLAVVGTRDNRAYVFRLSGKKWVLETVLEPAEAGDFINFGASVAVDQGKILIGAPMDSTKGLWAGSAFVFTRVGGRWTEEARLTASGGSAGEGFGENVGLSGGTAIVSAPNSDDLSGASYIFKRGPRGWAEQAKLETGCTAPYDIFGGSVSIDGNCAAVGACGVSEGEQWAAGAVYIFRRSGDRWRKASVLTPARRQKECFFGYSIALDGSRVLVGAHCQDCPKAGDDAGTAYVFNPKRIESDS